MKLVTAIRKPFKSAAFHNITIQRQKTVRRCKVTAGRAADDEVC